jgi:PAS domain S-box-containing protein
VGIFAVDRDARCTIWNRAMADLTGIAAEEMLGRDVLAIRWPLDTDRPTEALRSALAGKAKVLRDETYRNRAGEERFFAVHFSPLHDAAGRPIGAIGFIRDTTQRHELEDRLRQMQKLDAIGQLTGTVAHDFNNLLTVILGNLDRARRGADIDPRLGRMLEATIAAAERGEKLTQQLLAFARRQRLTPQPVDANALIAQVSDMLKRTLSETIALKLELAARVPRAAADPHQLEVALLNLALNAQAAMPGGGTLTIETASRPLTRTQLGANEAARPGRFVMIAVRDTGSGMTAQVKRRAFEPFFTTKPRGAGTGLGLSQVYGFAMQSLGHVRIDSRVGRGTAIELYLPVAAGAAKRRAPPQREPAVRGDKRTVLVVEDSGDVRAFAKAVLEEHGHRIVEAGDAEEAIRRMHSHPEVDLVFTDVVMPGRLSGLDLARDLRRRRPELPVVLTTGYTESLRDIEREGFTLLLKPYRPSQLTQAVEQAASARAAAEQPAAGDAT